eukprot:362835-Chlamydomonas_euryale.AAC.2
MTRTIQQGSKASLEASNKAEQRKERKHAPLRHTEPTSHTPPPGPATRPSQNQFPTRSPLTPLANSRQPIRPPHPTAPRRPLLPTPPRPPALTQSRGRTLPQPTTRPATSPARGRRPLHPVTPGCPCNPRAAPFQNPPQPSPTPRKETQAAKRKLNCQRSQTVKITGEVREEREEGAPKAGGAASDRSDVRGRGPHERVRGTPHKAA